MRRRQQWFGGSKRNSKKQSSWRRRTQLGMENLEERELMTVDFAHNPAFGGTNGYVEASTPTTPALTSPPVYLIFEGAYFATPAGKADVNAMVTATQTLVNGPYLSGLKEYGGDGKATFGTYWIGAADMNPLFSTANLNSMIYNTIENKNTPIPRPGTPAHAPIYVAVTDPFATSAAPNAAGYNDDVVQKFGGTAYNTHEIWASTSFNKSTNSSPGINLDNFTLTLSHELAETISDPDGHGVRMARPANLPAAVTPGSTNDQICDFETDGGNYGYRVNGILVQSYWSVKNNVFEIPDGNTQTVLLTPNWGSDNASFKGNSKLTFVGASNAVLSPDNGTGAKLILGNESFQFEPAKINGYNAQGFSNRTLTVDDRADATQGANYTLGGGGTQDTLLLPSGAPLQTAASVGSLHLWTSRSIASQVNINSSDKYTTLDVEMFGGGNTTVNFHQRSAVLGRPPLALQSNVSVYGKSNATLSVVDAPTSTVTYTVNGDSVSESSGPTLTYGLGRVQYFGNAGSTDLEFNAPGYVPVNVYGGTGSTTVHLASSYLSGAFTPPTMNFFGGGGYDLLFVDDGDYAQPLSSSQPFNVYEMSDHSVSVRNFTVNYDSGVDHVKLWTSDAIPSIAAIYGTAYHTTAEVAAGRAATTVIAEFNSYDLTENLNSNLTIQGTPACKLEVSDYANWNETYTITDSSVSNNYDAGTVSYAGFGTVNISGGTGGNTFDVQSTNANALTTVSGMSGDAFNIGDANNTLNEIAGPLELHGALPLDSVFNSTLTLNDSLAQPGTFTLAGNQYTRAGIAPITWDNMGTVTVNSAPLPVPPAADGAGQNVGGLLNNPLTNPGDPASTPGVSQILENPATNPSESASTPGVSQVFNDNPVMNLPNASSTPSVPVSSTSASVIGLRAPSLLNRAALVDAAFTQF